MSRIISIIGICLFLLVTCYVCTFQIIDYDVWWHIAAGRIMRSTGSIISIDPFSYVREGMPYLASHEWFAQVIISVVYDLFGDNGIIFLRISLVFAALVPSLFILRKHIWIIAPITSFAVISIRPAILDRPQLFSFVLFSFALFFAIRLISGQIRIKTYIIIASIIQIFWVNLHGGAALLHLVIVGAVFLQILFSHFKDKHSFSEIWRFTDAKWVFLLAIILFLILFLSPVTIHNFSYVYSLFTDNTANLIHEWAPRDSAMYIRWIVPWWIFGIVSLVIFRRSFVFSALLLFVFGFLSLQAIRHEPFFVITALLLTSYHLSADIRFNAFVERMEERIWPSSLYLLCFFLIVFFLAHGDKAINSVRLGIDGYGSYQPLQGAFDYLERENIEGKMFNNYEAGGYLLFRGYPDRKVFVDGRNVEYGYDFLKDLFSASYDASVFRKLEKEYGFTYAVIQFDFYKELERLPYIYLFNSFSDWVLVYIDDTAAVYVNKFSYSDIAKDFSYSILTPELILFPTGILQMQPFQYSVLEKEINNAILQSNNSINFRLRLAKSALFFVKGDLKTAESIILDLRKEEPNRFEPVNLLAIIRNEEGRYKEAGLLFEDAIRLGGGEKFISMDYEFLSSIFEKAGDMRKARYYKMKN